MENVVKLSVEQHIVVVIDALLTVALNQVVGTITVTKMVVAMRLVPCIRLNPVCMPKVVCVITPFATQQMVVVIVLTV